MVFYTSAFYLFFPQGLGSLDDDDPNIILAIQLSLQESAMAGGGSSHEANEASLGAIGTSLPSQLERSVAGVEALTRASLSSVELLELGDSLAQLGNISSHYSASSTVSSSAQHCESHMYRTSLPIPVAPGGSTSSDTIDSSSSSALAVNTNLLGNIMAWFHDMNPQGVTLVPPTSSDTDTNLFALHTEDEDESLRDEHGTSAVVVPENKKVQEVEADASLSNTEKECAVAERPTQLDLLELNPMPLPYMATLDTSGEHGGSAALKVCHVDTPQCDSVSDQLPSTSSSEWEEQVHLV